MINKKKTIVDVFINFPWATLFYLIQSWRAILSNLTFVKIIFYPEIEVME